MIGSRPSDEELVVAHHKIVLGGFLTRVRQPRHLGPGQPGHHLGQVTDPVGLGHLVEDLHPVARSLGASPSASSMQRTLSWIWMKARVCPPVPCTVSGYPMAAWIRKRFSTVP